MLLLLLLLTILASQVPVGPVKGGMKVMLPNEALKHMELLFDREESIMHLLLAGGTHEQ